MSSTSVTVPASPTTVTHDIDVRGSRYFTIVLQNTGAVNVASVGVSATPDGTLYGNMTAIGAAIGVLAAGATSEPISFRGAAYSTVRLTFTSAGGATAVTVETLRK